MGTSIHSYGGPNKVYFNIVQEKDHHASYRKSIEKKGLLNSVTVVQSYPLIYIWSQSIHAPYMMGMAFIFFNKKRKRTKMAHKN